MATRNFKNGKALEVSHLGEWVGDSYCDFDTGFDLIVSLLGRPLHIVAFGVRDNHVGICVLNWQIVWFWKD